MERLVTTTEAAQMLGLSLQGVHYRIKSGQLKSLKQGGKTFVYVTEFFQELKQNLNTNDEPKQELNPNNESSQSVFDEQIKILVKAKDEQIESLAKAKDEQISLLKQSIGFIKEQYANEITRLEKNQKRLIKIFNSEIQLLQSAFNEMRSIYKPQVQASKNDTKKFISMNDFFLFLRENKKNDDEIKIIILNRIKQKDSRFVYNKKVKKILILNTDYSDLI